MPRHCSADGCRSRDTKDSRINGITFHRLPKKGKCQREIWLLNCCRMNSDGSVPWDPPSQFVYFCSKHFEKHCFELVGLSGYHRLRDDAVPTIFQLCPRGKAAVRGANRERTMGVVGTSQCPTHDGSLPVADLRSTDTIAEMGCGISRDGSAFVLSDCDPQERVSESVCSFETSLTDAPLPTSQPELGALAPAIIYLIDVDSQLVELEDSGNTEGTSKDISSPQPDALTEHSADSPEGPDNHRGPVPIALYMARIPSPIPRPGAYIAVEHSYTVGCPLVWKKRAEALKEAFEKASKELRASRKRESRLRARITSILRPRGRVLRHTCTELDGIKGFPAEGDVFEVQVVDEPVAL
uniref:THAP domain-containing protein 7 isoform X1 n=1 Tax=Pristiophorus japonicus TaxID=55135 RepID=UPI00398E66B0